MLNKQIVKKELGLVRFFNGLQITVIQYLWIVLCASLVCIHVSKISCPIGYAVHMLWGRPNRYNGVAAFFFLSCQIHALQLCSTDVISMGQQLPPSLHVQYSTCCPPVEFKRDTQQNYSGC